MGHRLSHGQRWARGDTVRKSQPTSTFGQLCRETRMNIKEKARRKSDLSTDLPVFPSTNASMSTTAAARPHTLPILSDSAQCVRSACCRNGRAGKPVLESIAEAFPMCGGNCSCPRRRLRAKGCVQDMGFHWGGGTTAVQGGWREVCIFAETVRVRPSPRRTPTCRPKQW